MSKLEEAPIVLLHGWGMNKNIWQLILPQLKALTNRPILTLDLPGFGDNQTVLEPYDIKSLADWLNDQIEQPSIVIGWSLGGLVAQAFASAHPEKVHRLGLIGSTTKFMANGDWPGIKPEVLTAFADQLVDDHMQTIERFMAIQAMGSAHAKQDIKQIKQIVLAAPSPLPSALSAGLRILQEVDLSDEFAQIDCPIYAIFGRLDSLVPIKVVPKLAALNSSMQSTTLTKASHAPFISNPEEFLSWFEQLI